MSAIICCSSLTNLQRPFADGRIYTENNHNTQHVGLTVAVEKLQIERSKVIDMEIKKQAEMNDKIVKILLLGASDSGKSTIAKQMRILHTDGFTHEERQHYK
uniref:Uncharacterized protein n=1 Tax=Meloidogyne enterolobii TaxID=390850 RepID=A0A6V7UET3_MELEN|nr:unnamed protein product [Meloidogyne enterolobii]